MQFRAYDFREVEPAVLSFWKEKGIHAKANAQNEGGEPFYFLDGPPYANGKVHIGTTWNKSMKDAVMRFRRMQGRKVWDRAGYDMHGLPIEHFAMRELGLKHKDEIEDYGVDRYVSFCRDFAIRNLTAMNDDFRRMGVWMDFDNPYQTISDEWMDAVWWLVKQAYGKGRLYEGLRPMYWDPSHESSLAKHELIYKTVEDTSIYVKFRSVDDDNEYFIVWTTTPWTIPFNLMIMVNPEVEYARVKVDDEVWIVADDLRESVLEAAGAEGEVIDTMPGKDLVGREYEHFFADELDYASLKKDHPNIHTIVSSKEYVTTESGSGLVHAAPGCGPEDYEVGVREDVPAWNLLDERGRYPEGTGRFSGKEARKDDHEFTGMIEERGMLIARQQYVHDYPHAERSKAPIVYKTTKQWFFRVDDLKEQMVSQNKEVNWVPEAGFNAFNSWLENLRDNSITKQRYWGTPFPVWRNVDDDEDILVVGSRKELEELLGSAIEDMHKPWIDDVVIEKDGKTYRRIPDVIDVWVDAGVAAWACLKFPDRDDLLKEYFPADFIIEGNDQIRGWFNLLMIASTLAFDKAPFRNVYMHGMIQDSQGRKMSKSEGNYILPEEVVSRFGADAVRLYMIGGTKAGQDLNYNMDDCENKQRSLMVYWNIHKYLLDLIAQSGKPPRDVSAEELGVEERYILSRTHNTIQEVTRLVDSYRIDRIPQAVESLLDEISRTYIQLVRPRVSQGDGEELQVIVSTLWHAYDAALRMIAPITPFITEAIWHNLRSAVRGSEDSVHLRGFPVVDESLISLDLEMQLSSAQQVISLGLAARDQAQTGVRWPLSELSVRGAKPFDPEIIELVKQQVNVKGVSFTESLPLTYSVSPNFRSIGKEFGQLTADIGSAMKGREEELGALFNSEGVIKVAGVELGKDHLTVTANAPEGFAFAEDQGVAVLLATEQDDDLLREGFVRELIRNVQQLRKGADLDKRDRIKLLIHEDLKSTVGLDEAYIANVCGASEIIFVDDVKAPHQEEVSVRDRVLRFGFFHADT